MDRQNPFEEIDRLFDRISSEFADFEPATGLSGEVAVDVADTGEAFEVTADVPGYTSDDIDVTLPDPRTVRIAASQETTTETGDEDEDHQYLRQERTRRSTSRTVALPDRVRKEDAEASYDNGVLTIRLPKQEASEGTDIPVN
ncbi:Hsp20/alpha crystallin family protein [Halorientalis pallida]|uniref:Hsp20/alpha crystallin family protein n=1 Tax=Halorientalis pallida TaxID=2479928 RepID=A0A498KQR2_9EURY|nr:Hsp20/alpha crystallin family protein [Halorientalis pallida]RXK46458.1 Hsp20/alpha crystallin family protein [Halorientalis pallida]